MNKLHKAYQVLGLEVGSPFEKVKTRYKRLVMVWHPDRMNNDDGRKEAEEELKQINSSFEALKTHFESVDHNQTANCSCKTSEKQQTKPNNASPGPGAQRTKPSSEYKQKQSNNNSGATEQAAKEELERKLEVVRWRIAYGCGIALVVLIIFGWLGIGIKGCVHGFIK